jgi:hypothetical protein
MATLTGYPQAYSGDTSVIDTTKQVEFLTRSIDKTGAEYVYLKGVASTLVGS